MRFTWKALVFAPLLVPLILGGVFSVAPFSPGARIFSFLFFFVPSVIVSYGTTIFLFLPCLYLASKVAPLTLPLTCILGTLLGMVAYLPLVFLAWRTTGPDSGPPDEPFVEFFARWVVDPLNLIFPVAGLMTAAAYWLLASRRTQRIGRSPH